MRIAWWGDSLIEAYEAHNPRLVDPADLPQVGSMVEITQWRHRGFSHATTVALQAQYPSVDIESANYAHGGATSADVLTDVRAGDTGQAWHVAVVGCGTNDVCSLAKFICCSFSSVREIVPGRRYRVSESRATTGEETHNGQARVPQPPRTQAVCQWRTDRSTPAEAFVQLGRDAVRSWKASLTRSTRG
ncbi:hypothetical protein [Nocardia araoensis]|uniref:hypothetical protein n=1 Tax=Nocardia araoensis TaxID=228600 RepID=UPI0012F68BAC|nr:hypothetical protein [Nocardia araoensis]